MEKGKRKREDGKRGEERTGEGRREEKQGEERKRSKSGGVMAKAEKKESPRIVEQSQKSKRSAFLKRKFLATSETPVVRKPTEYA